MKKMEFSLALISISIAVLISTVADVYLKKSHLNNLTYILIGIILYAIAAPLVAVGFKIIDFSVVFFAWEAVAIILGLTFGILLFKEELSLMKIAAFTFSILAVLFSYLSTK